ncbi:hypothetical protein DQ04_08211020 [Trypanosoma grayi]|uniref:hypothetical protein n=1 Tax=Trypanosoma grayi TaxID=71804 RepID=UPI0004F488A2|nr:hypothetical protein DQ04_08211020 [Trypanosoma grayi]KEG08013.1 hypothetical protein DQ04_08211020 [Trypanosoma grayi]
MLPSSPKKAPVGVEWVAGLLALLALVEHCGRTPFSFFQRPNFITQADRAEGILTIKNCELIICLGNGAKASFVSLWHSIVPLGKPKNENFLKAFDDARATFRTEWMALGESRSILHQPYEMARAQMAEENIKIQQGAYAQTVGSHDCINQMPKQINTLGSHKNQLRDEKNQTQSQIH